MARDLAVSTPGPNDPAANARTREVIERSRKMFSMQSLWLPLWQELAENYHPARAEFTNARIDYSEYAENIFESTPVLYRRDFSLAMGAILRPPGKNWFDPRAMEPRRNTEAAMAWFNNARDVMRTHLYSSRSGFRRAVRESDDDFATFGNSVVGITENRSRNALKFTCYHLRDCAWGENADGEVDCLDRKEKYTLRRIRDTFGEKALRPGDHEILKENPNYERSLLICCMPADVYDRERSKEMRRSLKGVDPQRGGWIVCYIDEEQQKELRCDSYPTFPYWVRRWELQRGSVYATSPPAMVGLPDSRMAQVLAQITQEAAEKQIDPPLVATRDAVWEGPNTFAGGVTWIDKEYDERLGDAIRPLDLGKNAGVGLDVRADLRQLLAGTFYINKLSLPLQGDMTAYEVGQRIDEYIRTVGPVMEPFEEDNAVLLELIFSMLARLDAFGGPEAIPPEISDAEIKFTFETPVQQAYERRKVLAAQETLAFAGTLAQTTGKTDVLDHIDGDVMMREVAFISGSEAGWLKDPELVVEERIGRMQEAEAATAKQEQLEQMAMLEKGISLVPAIGQADQILSQIMGPGWMENLMGSLGGGAGQAAPQSNRLLPPPPGSEPEQEIMPPMMGGGMGMAPQQPRQGFAGSMPSPQPQQQGMDMGMQMFAAVLAKLSDSIDRQTEAYLADSEIYKGPDGQMRSRKVMPQGQAEAAY